MNYVDYGVLIKLNWLKLEKDSLKNIRFLYYLNRNLLEN